MGRDNKHFPESDAWAASMPNIRGDFAEAFPRRAEAPAATSQVDAEYKKFAKIDLSNAF